MKQLVLGAVTGLALALGMLGLQTPDIGVANRVLVGESLDNISPRVDLLPHAGAGAKRCEPWEFEHRRSWGRAQRQPDFRTSYADLHGGSDSEAGAANPYEPNGHSDSNTQGTACGVVVRLNQNVIKGETTSLCTRDASIRRIVDRANDLWNNALRTSLGFVVFEISTDPLCAGTAIEVVQRGDPAKSGNARCTNEFNPINGIGDWACYLFDKNEDPPRQYFSTSDKSADQVHSSLHNRAVIVYQALTSRQYSSVHPYHLGAMAHEPGHALGLGHYENHETPEMTTIDRCNMLRD